MVACVDPKTCRCWSYGFEQLPSGDDNLYDDFLRPWFGLVRDGNAGAAGVYRAGCLGCSTFDLAVVVEEISIWTVRVVMALSDLQAFSPAPSIANTNLACTSQVDLEDSQRGSLSD